jgi:hypothetical protein
LVDFLDVINKYLIFLFINPGKLIVYILLYTKIICNISLDSLSFKKSY